MSLCELCRDTRGVTEYDDDGDPISLCPECAFHEGFTHVDHETDRRRKVVVSAWSPSDPLNPDY